MGSSETMDSGRFSGQRSNFSHTCALLSQYLKEKGSFGDLSLGTPTMNLMPTFEKPAQTSDLKPLNLFPTKNKIDSSVGKADPERAPMTIFYNGQMIMFNEFPVEKAKELIAMATNTQTPNILPCADVNSVVPRPAVSKVVPGFGNQRAYSDLPIARRSSLARFLEKRKDRLTSKAPYLKGSNEGASSEEEENKAWLGLTAQFPVKIEPEL
nr:protein TIFY 10A-like [Ipomoea batatas]GMD35375.1 protein TIFY 10A-like [Ipomoea batatas]